MDLNIIFDYIREGLWNAGLNNSMSVAAAMTLMWLMAIALAAGVYYLVSVPGNIIVQRTVKNTRTSWDNHILNRRVVQGVGLLLASIAVYRTLPEIAALNSTNPVIIIKICKSLVIVAIFVLLNLLINSFYKGLIREEVGIHGMTVVRNILQTVIAGIAALLLMSVILSRDITYILSGIGALTAVLMVVFKDSILGMAAGIRLVINKMLKLNDWIIVPAFNANGRVTDITLTAVKVRNWDNSISTIPPHALIADGFQNMESMIEQGSRQIRHIFFIDASSVRMIKPGNVADSGISLPSGTGDAELPNITLWRRYLRDFIDSFPATVHSGLKIVRELQGAERGIPIEVLFFISVTEWKNFEEVKADISDSLIASLPAFGLRLYQSPSGNDLQPLGRMS